jgi:gluconolactonase
VTLSSADSGGVAHARRRRALATILALLVALTAGARPAGAAAGGKVEALDPRFAALVPADARVEILTEGIQWAEGPLWDKQQRVLLFSDVPRNAVFAWRPRGGVSAILRPSGYTGTDPFIGNSPGANGLTFDAQGRLVLCQHGDRRVARREADGEIVGLADRYDGKRLNSPNDLVYGPDGALYFTDPVFGLPRGADDPGRELDFQGVYRLAADGTLTAIVKDLRAPNGLAFSPDGKTLYVSNSDPGNPVWMAYPVKADGTVGPGRVFADARPFAAEGKGSPDGLEVDAKGNLFATGPAGVHVFAPDGTRLGRIVTGVPTGNVAWGDDGHSLYIAAEHRILRVHTTTSGQVGGAAR